MTPLAVSGRWRSVTSPARRTGVPCASGASSRERRQRRADSCARSSDSGCRPRVSAEAGVVGLHVLEGLGHRQLHRAFANRAEQRQLLLHAADRPARAVAVPGQAAERAGVGEQAWLATLERGALAQLGDIEEGSACARLPRSRRAAVLAQAADFAQAQPDGGSGAFAATSSSVQSQSLWRTSTGRTATPCRRASCTSWSGE